jgi:hypothetical protein
MSVALPIMSSDAHKKAAPGKWTDDVSAEKWPKSCVISGGPATDARLKRLPTAPWSSPWALAGTCCDMILHRRIGPASHAIIREHHQPRVANA